MKCPKHNKEFNPLLWCPMCLIDEQEFRDKLAKDAAEDAKCFEYEQEYLATIKE